ncbi:protein CDV3 homolog A-like [Antedon mediterranea]|uniref:protein CDV3 homolog A-like n=1 Tax=Antedon mediterranea TaxID=105859 RepID=UPI003AF64AE3
MTDKSVEDFFAKKDKSKRSKSKANKSKFTTSDQIAKTLSTGTTASSAADGEKKEKKEKKQNQVFPVVTDETGDDIVTKPANEIPQGDDEWKDFDDPSTKDYSGLRIQSLQIGTGNDADEQIQEGDEFDENGELVKSDGTSGPWNKQQVTESSAAEVVEKPAPEPVAQPPPAPEPEAPKSNKYVPPAKRAGATVTEQSMTPSNDRLRRRKKMTAPEITSESDFPSLSASIDIAKYKTKESERDFETVTKGSSRGSAEDPSKKNNQIETQNKYSALQQN